MAGLMLATKQAKQPYYVSELNKNIYSLEELSYFLYNYMYLVDERFFSDKLVNYVENVLGNPTIAQGIRQTRAHGGRLTDTIAFVVKTSGYYSDKELDKFTKQLELLGNKTNTERIKAKADILMETGKYNLAQTYYNRIIKMGVNPDLPSEFYGNVYHNIGVTYVKMFSFELASEYFARAYGINKDNESLKSLIISDIMAQDDRKLERDIEKYDVPQSIIDDWTSDIDFIRADVSSMFDEDCDTAQFLEQCRAEYTDRLNAG